MTEGSSAANLEMAIVLPLAVVAHQLMRIEADLRLLNMKALDFANAREEGPFGNGWTISTKCWIRSKAWCRI